jgi:hypothetical protein
MFDGKIMQAWSGWRRENGFENFICGKIVPEICGYSDALDRDQG